MNEETKYVLKKSIRELDLPLRTILWLEREGINTIGQLSSRREEDILAVKYCGKKKLENLKDALKKIGLNFGKNPTTDAVYDNRNIYLFPFFNNKETNMDSDKISLKNLEIPINALGIDFSVRAMHTLEALKIKFLKDILIIPAVIFLNTKNAGKKTLDEITRAVRAFIESNDDILEAFYNENKDLETQRETFPLFRDTFHEIDIKEIRESKIDKVEIVALGLKKKLNGILRGMGILTLKELLYTNIVSILKCCTPTESVEIREKVYVVTKQILRENGKFCKSTIDCIEYLESESLTTEGIFSVLSPREKRILELRYGFKVPPKTLKEVAIEIKITRERVRQIEKKAVEKINSAMKISCKLTIEKLINDCYENGGMITCEGIEDCKGGNGLTILNELIKNRDKKIQHIHEIGIWKLRDDKKDKKINTYLEKKCKVGDCFSKKALERLVKECGKTCSVGNISPKPLNMWVTSLWFKESNKRYFFKRIRPVVLIEETFRKNFPKGVAVFKEYDKIIAAFKKEGHVELSKVSKSHLQNTIIGINNILLWDWGVYIHEACIKINEKILDEVQEWLRAKLVKHKLQKVSLWGAFKQLKDKCRKAGIPNEHALYSCMKMKFSDKYSFLEDPYVYPLGVEGTVEGKDFIEQYLLNAKKPVSVKEIGEVLGIKDFQITGLLNVSDRIKAWGLHSYVHVDNISIRKKDLEVLVDYVSQHLAKYTHLSVNQIFQDKIITCKNIGIENPKTLYSVLEHYYKTDFFFPRVPYILVKDHGIEDDGFFSLNDLVDHFFNTENRIISQQELLNYFVKQRGYKKSRIENISYLCDNIVKYSQGTYVSLETINWDNEKEKMLEDVAKQSFGENVVLGLPFSNIDDLLECSLPKINENTEIHWQRMLVRELIERIEGVRVLGSIRGIYVITPNEFNIETIEDLICYILKKEFQGATSKDVLIKRLKELRITGTLSGKNKEDTICKYVVDGEEVYLSEMGTQ